MRVLVIEDDSETATYIVEGLKTSGYRADHVSDGRDGLIVATTTSYDVIIVDRMLPGLDGLAMVKTIREAGVKAPVLFLHSARWNQTTAWKALKRAVTTILPNPSLSLSLWRG